MVEKHTELSVIYEGHVQGVGFRITTVHHAQQLALSGYVRNTHNGNVELLAQGPRPKLDALLREIRSSTLGRHIFNETISWSDVTTPMHSFTIRY